MNLKRLDGENTNEYLWRVCGYKQDGLIELNWDELGDIINHELFGEDVEQYRTSSAYRKPYQYVKMFYDDVFSKMTDENSERRLKELQEQLRKERIKLNTEKLEYNRNLRKQSRFELFYEDIKDSINKIEVPKFKERAYDGGKVEYLLTIADIHCGANFISENNSYSLQECSNRFEKLLSETISFVVEKGCSHVSILELGDSVQGVLRLNDLKINETSVVEATIYVAKLISQFLNELSAYCDIDYYHCPTSNHSQIRPLGSKANELAVEDIEYIIGNYIKDTLADNPSIQVHTNFGKEYIDFEINGSKIIAMHGHQIKNIDNALRDLSQLRKVFYDIVFLAHYHAGRDNIVGDNFNCDAEVNVCPSFVGSDPYADSLFKGAKASCKIYGISDKGHTETYKITLN